MTRLGVGGNRNAVGAFSLYLWVTSFVIILLFSIFKDILLPQRFFYDAGTINSIIPSSTSFVPGASYQSTAFFYKILGVDINSSLFVVISSVAVTLVMFGAVKFSGRKTLKLHEIFIFLFLSFLSVVFIPYLTKEFIAFIPVLFLMSGFKVLGKNKAIAGWTLLVLFYGVMFRTYWILFIVQFYLLYFIYVKTKSVKILLISGFFSLLCMTLILQYGLGVDVNSLRNNVNERRLEMNVEDARTMIRPWIDGGGALNGFVNFSITAITLIFPVPLFLMLTPYHVFISLMLSWIGLILIKNIRNYTRLQGSDPIFEFCVVVLISFVLVQSMFEPDYGSYLRHLSPFFPFLVIALFRLSSKLDA